MGSFDDVKDILKEHAVDATKDILEEKKKTTKSSQGKMAIDFISDFVDGLDDDKKKKKKSTKKTTKKSDGVKVVKSTKKNNK